MTKIYSALGGYTLSDPCYKTKFFRPDIERISLHPVLDNEGQCEGPDFKVRVAWKRIDGESWNVSCRCMKVPGLDNSLIGDGPMIGTYAEAVEWLRTGKAPATNEFGERLFVQKQLSKLRKMLLNAGKLRIKTSDQLEKLDVEINALGMKIDDLEYPNY